MRRGPTIEQASVIFESAFLPLRCVAEAYDHGVRMRFRVYGADEPVLSADDLLRSQVTDSRRLKAIIAFARTRLEERGFSLKAWHFPDDV